MSSKGITTSLLFTFLIGLFLCSCGNIKGPSFPYVASPRVIVTTPSSPASGDITTTFQLIDRELEQGDITVEYSTDGAQTFTTATLTATSQVTSLASDWYPGIEHTIQWDSVSDMVGRSGDATVCIRITASDATNPLGNAGVSGAFTVNNLAFNEHPGTTVDTPAGIQHGSVQITYTLTDTEGDTCSIAVEYSVDSGAWQTASMGPAGDGTTGLPSSPTGTQHLFLWDSRADGVGLTAQQDNVKVRITPVDFNQGTAGETSVFSVDNTIVADFSASPTSGYAPLLVSFTDLSTSNSGIITSWSWDFGDGGTSIVQHPDHTYTTAGSYTVSLTVAGPDGTDTITRTDYITVTELPVIDTFYVATTGNDTTGDGTVDSPYATIQKGLDSATSATTVIVFDGTYTGTGNKDLDFTGKAIHLKSASGAANCIIDCQSSGRGFWFHTGETNEAIVEGFTVTNGYHDYWGGGIYCEDSNPTILKCRITGNRAGMGTADYYGGGGIACLGNSNIKIIDCVIIDNNARWAGGGIYLSSNSIPEVTNCLIANNSCGDVGGGIHCGGNPVITNCTIAYNSAGWQPAGVMVSGDGTHAILNNCIAWGNRGSQVATRWSGQVTLNSCCTDYDPYFIADGTYGWTEGGGVIGDYHLQASSPCIDAGNNSYVSGITTDLDGNPRIQNGSVDIGAYESSVSVQRNWTQRFPANKPSARGFHAMAYDSAHNVVVLFGGLTDSSPVDDTWEWNGTNWMQKFPPNSPPARSDLAMAYDSARGVVVLFGGDDGSIRLNDTWEYDGTNWTQKLPANKPSGRTGPAMAYDSTSGMIVLHGGYVAPWVYSDGTWEWNGTNWAQRSPANKPAERNQHAMVYDSNCNVVLLFGGVAAGGGTKYQDTWEWNGTNWAQKTPTNKPSVRWSHSMAYDSATDVAVLFGGWTGSSHVDDTWMWNGTDWTQKSPASKPSARREHAMAYDSARGVVVLFGGYDDINFFDDTWEY